MSYEEFKTSLVSFLKTLPETSKCEFLIMNKGYDENDAKANHFPVTKGVDEFNNFLIATNKKFFGNESLKLEGDILLAMDGNGLFTRFDFQKLFEKYSENNDFVEVYHNMKPNFNLWTEKPTEMISKYSDNYEMIKEMLIIRPIHYDSNSKLVDQMLFKQYNDMALTLYFDLTGNRKDAVMSARVPKSLLNDWKLSFDEVFQYAMTNTYVKALPRMFNYDDFHDYTFKPSNSSNGAFMALNFNPNIYEYNTDRHLMLTTTLKKNGAIAMFYSGVKERIYDIFQSEYYAFFISTDSCYLYSAKRDYESIKKELTNELKVMKMVLGNSKAGEEYFISHYMYKYDKTKNEIVLIEKLID